MARMTALFVLFLALSMLLSDCGGTQATISPLSTSTAHIQPITALPATPASGSSPIASAPRATTMPQALATTQAPAQPTSGPAATPEQPVAPEQNPVGDIPDTQAFVPYTATSGGYTLDVPEGWARSSDGANVRFESKLNGVSVTITAASAAPTAQSARDHEVAALIAAGHAMTIASVDDVKLPNGSAILVKGAANSTPDPVTNKQIRQEQNIYLFYKNGKLATLTLWAPQGADNVDQWQRIAESFHWT